MKPKFHDILRDKLRSAGLEKWAKTVSLYEATKCPEFIKCVVAALDAYNSNRPNRAEMERED